MSSASLRLTLDDALSSLIAEKVDPFAFLTPGTIATHWQTIVRVVRMGSKDWLKFLPNCVEYEVLGWHGMPGRWWETRENRRETKENRFTSTTPHRSKPGDYWQTRADRIYFQPWDGKGMFFGTPKAGRIHALILQWRQRREEWQQARARDHHTSRHELALYQRMEPIEERLARLINTKAGPCPTEFQP